MTPTHLTRRSLIAAAGVAGAAAASPLLGAVGAGAHDDATPEASPVAAGPLQGMNVLLFMTDQQRHTQHFPPGWEAANLPALTRLKAHGVSFEQAICNSCMCSPSRATMMSGLFPAQHGVTATLEPDMPADQYPQVELAAELPNLGSIMAAAGYATPYKGKWHCSKPLDGNTAPALVPPCTPNQGWVPDDLARFGFERWNPQDAGENQYLCQAGGGLVDNDDRFMHDDGDVAEGEEGAIPYLRSAAAQEQPFFLTVSLVNPHDVLAYPAGFQMFGYDDTWLADTGMTLPATVDEDLSTKPAAQRQFAMLTTRMKPQDTEQQVNYITFYGNLMKETDAYLGEVLDTLKAEGLLENTLVIFTSDHGEMAMTHGGQVQKNFNAYEESIRVPLVFSNPVLFPEAAQSDALVSHVDLAPTLAALAGSPLDNPQWQGADYAALVLDPAAAGAPDYQVFTFADWQGGQPRGPYVRGANHIVAVRDSRYTIARYYAPDGSAPDEWELYDRETDPNQATNLAWPGASRDAEQEAAYQRMLALLAEVEQTRLQPLG
ncbi:MAG: sulfatase-like hydrolase/transferase [Thermomicrobiales bacterium]